MGRLLGWLADKLRASLGLFLPVLRKAHGRDGMAGWLRTVLHVLIVLLLLAGLFAVNQLPAILVLIPRRPLLARSWLPVLFLLLYALCWLSYWLWTLLVADDEGPRFADIAEAWEQALTALRQAGLHVSDLPVFLLLGQPEDEESSLFQAAGVSLVVKQSPPRPDAPLHVHASREAIYLTCAGASLLGRHARSLAGKFLETTVSARPQRDDGEADILTSTISPSAAGATDPTAGNVADMVKVLHQAELEGRPLTKVEKRELRFLYRQSQPRHAPLKDSDLMAREAARLHYLCRLLRQARHPFCAVNGVLLLLPFAGCDSDQDAVFTAEALHRDLAVATATLGVDCPHYALLCDVETAHGFGEFIQRFTAHERLRRLGQSCPLLPDLPTNPSGKDSAAHMLESLSLWICQGVMPTWIFRKFGMEKTDTPERAALIRANGRLFLLADELRERGKRLSVILARGLSDKTAVGPLLFGGCYLAGTGTDAEKEQGFVRGVLDRLTEGQSYVYWTRRTLEEEAGYRRWSAIGWTVLGIAILILVVVGGYYWYV